MSKKSVAETIINNVVVQIDDELLKQLLTKMGELQQQIDGLTEELAEVKAKSRKHWGCV